MIIKALIFLMLPLAVYSQSLIPFQNISSSGGGTIENSTSRITCTFGQGIASTSSTTLQSGFIPSVNVFINNGAPAIAFATSLPDILSNGDHLDITVTDNDVDSVKIYHRTIAGSVFTKENMTLTTDPNYTITVQSSWMDNMGTEYYFRAVDKTGKETRKPESTSEFFHSYFKQTTEFVPGTVYKKGGSAKKDYRIITIPDSLSDSSIGSQFGELNSQYDKSIYRIATYAGNNQWKEFPDIPVFVRGKGYWFLTIKNDQIVLENSRPPGYYQSGLFKMTLQPGWNQIGNPYTLPINWEDVRTFNSGININAVKIYDNGSYSDGNTLQPFQGGFVYLDETSAKQIQIPFQGQTSAGRIQTQSFSSDLADENWKLNLILQQDESINAMAAIGMSPQAQTDHDSFDDFNPPHFADYTEVEFPHAEHPQKFFVKDFVPTKDTYVWSFQIKASSSDELNLMWNNEHFGDNNIELYLLDEQNSRIINMRDVSTYMVEAGSHYKIYYGANIHDSIRPETTTIGKTYPNPFSLAHGTLITIPFALPGKQDQHTVQLQIIDSKGQPVRQLVNGTLSSGFYEATWNGNDHRDQPCAAGLYLYRLSIKGNNESTFTGKIVIIN
ncbi:MAG TPA: FlgD immunoglobulin-like domain containing protein [Cyclobacteriaceae bacterium]|nr:FlgD immunoglobulin-like domain containing protein [Cyclobacteriaceae bacterium]